MATSNLYQITFQVVRAAPAEEPEETQSAPEPPAGSQDGETGDEDTE